MTRISSFLYENNSMSFHSEYVAMFVRLRIPHYLYSPSTLSHSPAVHEVVSKKILRFLNTYPSMTEEERTLRSANIHSLLSPRYKDLCFPVVYRNGRFEAYSTETPIASQDVIVLRLNQSSYQVTSYLRRRSPITVARRGYSSCTLTHDQWNQNALHAAVCGAYRLLKTL